MSCIQNKEVIIYGATIGGKVILQLLEKEGVKVIAFCDLKKSGQVFCGKTVIHPKELKKNPSVLIVIALTRSYRSAIKTLIDWDIKNEIYNVIDLLEGKNLRDFKIDKSEVIEAENFLEKYKLYISRKQTEIILPTLEVFITEKCTLNCVHCTHLIPYYKNPKHLDMDKVCEGLENLFKVVNYVQDLFILGGEPLLHPNLAHLLNWLRLNHRICNITILTNGTLLPNENCVKELIKLKARIRISDYKNLSYNQEKLIALCNQNSIPVYRNHDDWVDLGTGEKHSYTIEQQRRIFANCPFSVEHVFIDGKLYRCAHGAHMQRLKYIPCEDIEYVDFLSKELNNLELQDKMLNYLQRESLGSCNWCNGYDLKSSVIPAIQIRRSSE